MSRLRRLLALPDNVPNAVVLTILFYLGHLFFQGWILSSELCVLGVLLCAIVAFHRRDLRPSFHILFYPLLVYCLVSSISALMAERAIHSTAESALWGKTLLFPTVLILYRTFPRTRDLSLKMMLFFGFFISAYGLFQYFILAQRDLEHRITGPASHVMTFSGLLLVISLMALVLWLHDVRNPVLAGVTAITCFSLLLTFTRSVWIGWGAAVVMLLALRRPRWLIFAPGVALLVLSFLPLPLFGRLVSVFDTKQSSNLDRIRMGGSRSSRTTLCWALGRPTSKRSIPFIVSMMRPDSGSRTFTITSSSSGRSAACSASRRICCSLACSCANAYAGGGGRQRSGRRRGWWSRSAWRRPGSSSSTSAIPRCTG